MFLYRSGYLFALMFAIILLLNVNFTILRSLRNTLAVADLGGGAHLIPLFELFAGIPGALIMTWGLVLLINRFSIEKVFLLTLSLFLGFFLLFVFVIYPFLQQLHQINSGQSLILLFFMLFYAMSELWKPALAIILFWGLVNQYVPLNQAKKLYAPLMLGGSLGAILAAPITTLCTSKTIQTWLSFSSERWLSSFILLTLFITLIGAVTGILYYRLWNYFSAVDRKVNLDSTPKTEKRDFSFKDSIVFCWQTPALRLLSWIVIADYIAYSLGEVIFLDVLKLKFQDASEYCNYMAQLGLWSGILTFISSLFMTPFVLQRCYWITAALVTPLCLLITEGLFFLVLRERSFATLWLGWSEVDWMEAVIQLGSLQYCLCRGAKYSFFDASKEIAFVLMPEATRIKGKLVIDGFSARIGRGAGSILSLSLITLCGGVLASSFLSGLIALGTVLSWIVSTHQLGRLLDKKESRKNNLVQKIQHYLSLDKNI